MRLLVVVVLVASVSQIQEFSAAENIELKSVLLNPAAPPEASTGLHRQQG